MEMGCYGIGVTRVVAAAIEQNHDEQGHHLARCRWRRSRSPSRRSVRPQRGVRALADRLHDELVAAGIDVLLDDRGERPGVMFADLELIGIPHRITIGDRGLKEGKVEYQSRRDTARHPGPVGGHRRVRPRPAPEAAKAWIDRMSLWNFCVRHSARPCWRRRCSRRGRHMPARRQEEQLRHRSWRAGQGDRRCARPGRLRQPPRPAAVADEMSRRIAHKDARRTRAARAPRHRVLRVAARGLDPQLVLGVIYHESGFKKYAVSSAGARGYMQVMPFWVKQIGASDQNLFNLRTNLRYGAVILRYYLDIENGDSTARSAATTAASASPNIRTPCWPR
jgi:hypothetical protein